MSGIEELPMIPVVEAIENGVGRIGEALEGVKGAIQEHTATMAAGQR